MTPTSGVAMPATHITVRDDLRNIAIVAHVDHGKTTLVDAMLRQSGVFRANQQLVDRVLDSSDLEREKGITILAKQTTVEYDGRRLNIVDTPGHADFGGEVERALLMVDASCCWSTRPRGRCRRPATCCRRRWPAACRSWSRSTRSTAPTPGRPRCSTRSRSCSSTWAPRPTSSTSRCCTPTPSWARRRPTWPRPGTDLTPLFDALVDITPAPTYQPDHPLQLLVTNLSANDYVGRLAVGRIWNGTVRVGPAHRRRARRGRRRRGSVEPGRTATLTGTVTSLTTAKGIERVDIDEAGPGEIVAVAGLPEVRSATPSPTRPTRGRCPAWRSTSRRCA